MIEFDEVKRDFDNIVISKGDNYFLGTTCKYIGSDDQPLCIVGCYLVNKHDIPVEFFREIDPNPLVSLKNSKGIKALAPELYDRFGLAFSDDALRFMSIAQMYQDEHKTWSHSVEHAAWSVTNSQ